MEPGCFCPSFSFLSHSGLVSDSFLPFLYVKNIILSQMRKQQSQEQNRLQKEVTSSAVEMREKDFAALITTTEWMSKSLGVSNLWPRVTNPRSALSSSHYFSYPCVSFASFFPFFTSIGCWFMCLSWITAIYGELLTTRATVIQGKQQEATGQMGMMPASCILH